MILDDIVANKREELAQVRGRVSVSELQERPRYQEPRRGFEKILRQTRRAIIAEVKKASPSKGVIRADFDPLAIAQGYAANGAAAISVLTEERFFQGSLRYLEAIRGEVTVPLLRKDFLFDPYQLVEARAYGADAALLIVAMLEQEQLTDLMQRAREVGLDVLVEVHDRAELDRAQLAGATLIGINNRDLRTFHTTLDTTEQLARGLDSRAVVVSESGIETLADIERLERSGVHCFLIGESLMRHADPGQRLAELLG